MGDLDRTAAVILSLLIGFVAGIILLCSITLGVMWYRKRQARQSTTFKLEGVEIHDAITQGETEKVTETPAATVYMTSTEKGLLGKVDASENDAKRLKRPPLVPALNLQTIRHGRVAIPTEATTEAASEASSGAFQDASSLRIARLSARSMERPMAPVVPASQPHGLSTLDARPTAPMRLSSSGRSSGSITSVIGASGIVANNSTAPQLPQSSSLTSNPMYANPSRFALPMAPQSSTSPDTPQSKENVSEELPAGAVILGKDVVLSRSRQRTGLEPVSVASFTSSGHSSAWDLTPPRSGTSMHFAAPLDPALSDAADTEWDLSDSKAAARGFAASGALTSRSLLPSSRWSLSARGPRVAGTQAGPLSARSGRTMFSNDESDWALSALDDGLVGLSTSRWLADDEVVMPLRLRYGGMEAEKTLREQHASANCTTVSQYAADDANVSAAAADRVSKWAQGMNNRSRAEVIARLRAQQLASKPLSAST